MPGGDPDAMYHTLTGKLAKLPRDTVLYPGHHYGPSPTSTIGDELLQVNQGRIAGECRQGIVGRMAISGGAERQDLPDALPGFAEKVDKAESLLAQITDGP